MEWLKWQQAILNEKEFEVIEVMSVRRTGKTTLGLGWSADDADLSVIITKNAKLVRKELNDELEKLELKVKEFHVISNLEQLRKINTNPKRKIKIVVDECFAQSHITLKKLDNALGHENYKVMFIGTRISKEDKFRIPFSKQYTVDLVQMFTENAITPERIADMFSKMDSEQLHIEFGTPFESN